MFEKKQIRHMKWWGWGREDKYFEEAERPSFKSFVQENLNIAKMTHEGVSAGVEEPALNAPRLTEKHIREISGFIPASRISIDDHERLVHSYGKSYRDLYRIRKGLVQKSPDLVIYPENESEIQKLLAWAKNNDICVVPFGGGTNIVGGVEVRTSKPCICLDMKRMSRVLDIDEESHLAEIQCGVLGPDLEKQLQKQGWTLGHFPDSFEFSTLGGWVATRSAGMQSDRFGKIEDMVVAIRLITPNGQIETLKVPKSSSGLDLKHMLIGSEGILGVITSVWMQIHPVTKKQTYLGFIFPSFELGVAALREAVKQDCVPTISRLNDPGKTQMSMSFKKPEKNPAKKFLSFLVKLYISKVKSVDLKNCAMTLVSFTGTTAQVKAQEKQIRKIYSQFGAICVGASAGETFNETKYDFPYVRDFVMDYGIIADVSETSVSWSKLFELYHDMYDEFEILGAQLGTPIFLSCHISHTYPTGASLYFTWACEEENRNNFSLKRYDIIKSKTEDVFLKHGATYSHHHATGYEHMPWVEKEHGSLGVDAVKALKSALDPKNTMNPGKVVDIENILTSNGGILDLEMTD